jgi:heme-degrading monooxygenase HmoA
MTYAFTYDVPITAEIYGRIKEGLGPEQPPGLIAHLALQVENGLRYIDVWETKDDFEAFAESRLHPVVHPILEGMLGFVPPEPSHTVLDVIDAWTDRHPV